jgi:DNA-binding LacI/PurR family transcriptional regulator
MGQLGIGRATEVVRTTTEQLNAAALTELRSSGVTALLIENDVIARRIETAALDLGLELPRDLSYALLGDPLEPQAADPDWTTFVIPRVEMGRRSIAALLTLLEHRPDEPQQYTLPCSFSPGASTARIDLVQNRRHEGS